MNIIDKYIPREYLALKINYCRRLLEQLPKAKIHERMLDGSPKQRIIAGKHRYSLNSLPGKDLYAKMKLREE